MQKTDFKTLLEAILSLYPNFSFARKNAIAWADQCEKNPFELGHALRFLDYFFANGGKFAPTISEIIRGANELYHGENRNKTGSESEKRWTLDECEYWEEKINNLPIRKQLMAKFGVREH